MRLREVRSNFKRISPFIGIQALIVLFYFWQHIADWSLLEISRIKGQFNFQDFVTIFTSSECFRDIGLQIYVPEATRPLCFYPYGRTLIYLIDLARISSILAPAIIVLISFAIMHISVKFFSPMNRSEKTFFLLTLISPPLWLAFERGNADLLICLLVLISAYFSFKNKVHFTVAILLLTTLIKFYTFPLLILILWRQRRTIHWFISVVLIVTTSYIIFTDIQMQNLQQPGSFAFGSPVVTFWINALSSNLNLPINEVSIRIGQVLGILILGMIALIFFTKLKVKSQLSNSAYYSLSDHCFYSLGVVYVTCFTLGMSYDYRLIFSALAGVFFIRSFENLGNLRWWFGICWLLSLWLSVFGFGLSPKMHLLIQWIGNGFDFITAGLILSLIVREIGIRQLPDRIS